MAKICLGVLFSRAVARKTARRTSSGTWCGHDASRWGYSNRLPSLDCEKVDAEQTVREREAVGVGLAAVQQQVATTIIYSGLLAPRENRMLR